MALPKNEKQRVGELLFDLMASRAAAFVRSQIWITTTTRGKKVTLIDECPYLKDPSNRTRRRVAQFEYDPTSKEWNLYWYDGKLKRHPYPNGNNTSLDKLIAEVIKDPTGIFWGSIQPME